MQRIINKSRNGVESITHRCTNKETGCSYQYSINAMIAGECDTVTPEMLERERKAEEAKKAAEPKPAAPPRTKELPAEAEKQAV